MTKSAKLPFRLIGGALAALFLFTTSALQPVKAQTDTVLYSFTPTWDTTTLRLRQELIC